jgi:phosphoribosylformylglycinamidine cyclo-ligase
MTRVFNLGIGMVIALAPDLADEACAVLLAAGHDARVIGRLAAGAGAVRLI